MIKFVRGKRKNFASEKAFLHDVFEKNKVIITQAYGKNAEEKFIESVNSYKKVKKSTTIQALATVSRSRAFISEDEMAALNVKQSIINYGKWSQFREMTRGKKGRFTAWNPDLLKWDKDAEVYIYNGNIKISFDNSPAGITLTQI